MCEIYKEDVRVVMARVCESQQYLVGNVRDVVGEMENQIITNNNRSNKKDEMLLTIREAIFGLEKEMEMNRTNHQTLQENQVKTERKLEEERRMLEETIQRNANSVQTHGEAMGEWIRKEQTIKGQNSDNELKREVKKENVPPGLTYGAAGRKFLDQGGRKTTLLVKQNEREIDSRMTERDTAQNQK